MTPPKPWKIDREGHVIDRATGDVVGVIRPEREWAGWYWESHINGRFWGAGRCSSRQVAAALVWAAHIERTGK